MPLHKNLFKQKEKQLVDSRWVHVTSCRSVCLVKLMETVCNNVWGNSIHVIHAYVQGVIRHKHRHTHVT